jgi:hypothetical protein
MSVAPTVEERLTNVDAEQSKPVDAVLTSDQSKVAASISLRPGGGLPSLSLRPEAGALSGGEPAISLRPGGGDPFSFLSLRPGGGPGFASTGFGPGPKPGESANFKFGPSDSAGSSGSFRGSSSHGSGGHDGSRRPGGPPPKQQAPYVDRSRQGKHERYVYTRDFIMSFKSKNTEAPPPALMDRIQGVYRATEDSWKSSQADRSQPSSDPTFVKDKWVPPSMKSGMVFTIDQTEKRKQDFEDAVRHVKGLLNKVTPENFDEISIQVLTSFNRSSTDDALLKEHCSLIFEKALSEPNYAFMWVDLCTLLSRDAIRPSDSKLFRVAVLNMCQDEFMRIKKEFKIPEEDFDADLHEKKLLGTMTEDDFNELEERRTKRKNRRFGTIKFIGELYNKGLLRKDILLACLKELLSDDIQTQSLSERCQNIEAFCKLVSTIGADANIADQRILRLQILLDQDHQLPNRIRFMMQNVLESRTNGWEPSVTHNPQPKKLGVVHANAIKRPTSSSKENVQEPKKAPAAPSPSAPSAGPVRSEDELKRMSLSLLEEYVASYDLDEAIYCVKEMRTNVYYAKYVKHILFSPIYLNNCLLIFVLLFLDLLVIALMLYWSHAQGRRH